MLCHGPKGSTFVLVRLRRGWKICQEISVPLVNLQKKTQQCIV
jgi:hypothetical protein